MRTVRTRPFEHACELSLLALLALTVLWKGGKTLESTWALVGVAAGCWLALSVVEGLRKRKSEYPSVNNTIRLLVMLFILWTGLSYVFSSTRNYGLDEVLQTGGLGLILLWYLNREAGSGNQNPKTFEDRFFAILTHTAVISCIIGLLVYVFQPVNRFVGTFFDFRFHTDYWPNAFGDFALLAWPVVLYCDLKRNAPLDSARRSRATCLARGKKVVHLRTGLVLGSLFLTFSRGALIAFLGQIGILAALLAAQKATGKTLRAPLKALVSALFAGFIVFIGTNELRSSVYAVQSVTAKVTFTAPERFSSVSERASFWRQALLLSVQKPVFGWGPYSFRFVQPRLQTSVLATSDHPHNVLLKLIVERGGSAALLFAALVFLALRAGITLSLTGKRFDMSSDHARLGYALLTASVAGVVAHNLIDYNLQFVGIALPFWLIMGILLRKAESGDQETGRAQHISRRLTAYHLPLTVLLAVTLLLIALREGIYLTTSSLGRHAETRGDAAGALSWYARSEREWFSRDLLLSRARLLLSEGDADGAREAIRAYLRGNAEDARAWKLLGEAHAQDDAFGRAADAYGRAFELGGWNDLGISRGYLEVLLAENYRRQTPPREAMERRETLPPDPRIANIAPRIEERVLAFTDAIRRNLHFVALSPNPEEAVKILIALSVLSPDKAGEYRALSNEIEAKALEEREKIRSRQPGWLW